MKKISLYILTSTFIITSCGGGGGGGGGGSSTPTPPSNPAPVINISASASTSATGELVTLNWSSSNANSCTASGSSDWSGDKGTSGSGDVIVGYGANTYTISCTGSGGTSSRNITVQGTQGFDATAFVGNGVKTYRGFLVHKPDDLSARFLTVEFDLAASEADPSILEFQRALVFEVQYLGYYLDDNDNPLGLKLSGDLLSDEYDAYNIPITDINLNGIYLNESVNVDPFNYPDATLDDLVQFSADINLDFDVDDENDWFPDLEMGILALPNDSPNDNTSTLMGYSEGTNSYTVLYLVEKDSWDENQSNKPSESDILTNNLAEIDLFTAYQSLPNFVSSAYGLKVNNETFGSNDAAQSSYTTETLRGSYKANSITVSDNQFSYVGGDYAVKYMFNSDSNSDQRIFFKMDTTRQSGIEFIDNYEVYFLSPDKSGFVGFKLDGYDGGLEGNTNIKLLFNND